MSSIKLEQVIDKSKSKYNFIINESNQWKFKTNFKEIEKKRKRILRT